MMTMRAMKLAVDELPPSALSPHAWRRNPTYARRVPTSSTLTSKSLGTLLGTLHFSSFHSGAWDSPLSRGSLSAYVGGANLPEAVNFRLAR